MAQRQWRSDDTDSWTYAFGDGSSAATYVAPANEGCSGAASGTSLTLATAGSFTDGMLVLIHQTRGSQPGKWELNKIASGGTTTSLTMSHDLMNTYADSGSNQAQIIELKQYKDLTISTTINPPSAWNGSKGGIFAILDKGTFTLTGTINLDAYGFNGGATSGNKNILGYQGEGETSVGAQSVSANANSGGSGNTGSDQGGAGGGNGVAGQTFGGGTGGAVAGGASLVDIVLGGSGGGASSDTSGGSGGDGGGMCFVFANKIDTSGGTITLDGGAGTFNATPNTSAGGGAGGSCLLKAAIATLGTTKIGAVGSTSATGGNGGSGRVHLDYSGSYTGTTSPTIDVTKDSTIVASSNTGNMFLVM